MLSLRMTIASMRTEPLEILEHNKIVPSPPFPICDVGKGSGDGSAYMKLESSAKFIGKGRPTI